MPAVDECVAFIFGSVALLCVPQVISFYAHENQHHHGAEFREKAQLFSNIALLPFYF